MFNDVIIPLKSASPPTPFPLGALPTNVRHFVEYMAKAIQVHSDMPAALALSVLSACVQGKAKIAVTPEWSEELNLYTAVIAEPGERKSAVFAALTTPVQEFVDTYNQLHAAEIAAYKNKLNKLEAQKSDLISKGGNDDDIEKLQLQILELEAAPKTPLRLIATDCTPEATAAVMAANNGKIAILSDEGVFDVMAGLYTNGRTNINIYLNSYDGQTISIDRKSSGSLVLERPLITFGVCCQPSVITDFVADKRFFGKGLAQRFLFCQPPSLCGKRTLINLPVEQNTKDEYAALINKLLSLPDSSEKITLSEEAFSAFSDFFNEIEAKIGSEGKYSDTRSFLNKLLGKTARISGLLHLCDNNISAPLNKDTMQNAIAIARYFIAQNELLMNENADITAAEYVVERIIKTAKKDGQDTYRARDLKRFCQKYKSKELDEILLLLEEHKYVQFIPDAGKQDRSCGKYIINQNILA